MALYRFSATSVYCDRSKPLPVKTPQAIVERIAADLARASNEPTQKQVLEKTGWELNLIGLAAFGELVRRERAVIGKVVAEIGLKPE